ncbi:MAG: hypothetical protein J1E80_00230 [Desulfovibrionaceae bacterium]|nr:hypothetical protein [Desulfovibrionaceae bacterium]
MPHPPSLSLSALVVFMGACLGLSAGNYSPAMAESAEQTAPGVRSPVVGGTAFPTLNHSKDSQAEVWRIRRPDATDKGTEDSQTPLIIVPEVRLPGPGHADRPQPRKSGRARP